MLLYPTNSAYFIFDLKNKRSLLLTCTINQHRQQHRRQEDDHDRRALPRASRRQSLAEVQRSRIVVGGCTAHGAAWRKNGSRIAAVVALQRVFGGRRARRSTFVFNRWSFVDIYGRKEEEGKINIRIQLELCVWLSFAKVLCVCLNAPCLGAW